MHVSAKSLTDAQLDVLTHQLAVVIAELKKPAEAQAFLTHFLTATEKLVLVKRLAIAVLLQQKKSYQEIEQQLNVSTATIASVSELSKYPEVQLALKRLAGDAWADKKVAAVFQALGL